MWETNVRFAVVNLKGGVGNTTTAVHLAVGLARRAPTVLVDSDPQDSASRWGQLAETLPWRTVSYPKSDLGSRLPELLGGASHLVIDTPPGHTDIVAAAVSSVDTVIIPVGGVRLVPCRFGDAPPLLRAVRDRGGDPRCAPARRDDEPERTVGHSGRRSDRRERTLLPNGSCGPPAPSASTTCSSALDVTLKRPSTSISATTTRRGRTDPLILLSRSRGRRHLPVTRSTVATCSAASSTSTTSQLESPPSEGLVGKP